MRTDLLWKCPTCQSITQGATSIAPDAGSITLSVPEAKALLRGLSAGRVGGAAHGLGITPTVADSLVERLEKFVVDNSPEER